MAGPDFAHGRSRRARHAYSIPITLAAGALSASQNPDPPAEPDLGRAAVADVFRPRWSLLTEIALLRHQLAILQRSSPGRA
jgi:hypothetical protein